MYICITYTFLKLNPKQVIAKGKPVKGRLIKEATFKIEVLTHWIKNSKMFPSPFISFE